MKNTNKKNNAYTVKSRLVANQFKSSSFCINKNLAALLLCFIMFMQQGICQQTNKYNNGNFGLAVSSLFNADGYGVQYLPAFFYKKKRGGYFLAPVIQKQKTNISGIQFNYEYTLVKEGEADTKGLEFFIFINALYQNSALLGKQTLRNECVAHPEEENVSQMHFKSIETYTGFGLRIKLFKNIKWVNSIGCGGYTSFNVPSGLYYTNHNFGLMLKTGISIDFKN